MGSISRMRRGSAASVALPPSAITVRMSASSDQAFPGAIPILFGPPECVVADPGVNQIRRGGARTFGYLAGAGGLSVVLIYLAVNIATIRAFRTEFRSEFRL
jgi:hypothetical protein